MRLRQLLHLILEDESLASQQAHKLGLTHTAYGQWADDTGKVVARTVNGQLVRVTDEPSTPAADQTPNPHSERLRRRRELSKQSQGDIDDGDIMGLGTQARHDPHSVYAQPPQVPNPEYRNAEWFQSADGTPVTLATRLRALFDQRLRSTEEVFAQIAIVFDLDPHMGFEADDDHCTQIGMMLGGEVAGYYSSRENRMGISPDTTADLNRALKSGKTLNQLYVEYNQYQQTTARAREMSQEFWAEYGQEFKRRFQPQKDVTFESYLRKSIEYEIGDDETVLDARIMGAIKMGDVPENRRNEAYTWLMNRIEAKKEYLVQGGAFRMNPNGAPNNFGSASFALKTLIHECIHAKDPALHTNERPTKDDVFLNEGMTEARARDIMNHLYPGLPLISKYGKGSYEREVASLRAAEHFMPGISSQMWGEEKATDRKLHIRRNLAQKFMEEVHNLAMAAPDLPDYDAEFDGPDIERVVQTMQTLVDRTSGFILYQGEFFPELTVALKTGYIADIMFALERLKGRYPELNTILRP